MIRKTFFAAFVTVATIFINNLSAQSIDKDTIAIDEVQVSAGVLHRKESSLKLLAPLKEIPLTTSSVGSDLMEQRATVSVNEATKYITGIHATQNYGGFQTFTMRGFGQPVIMVDGIRDERMNYSSSAPMTSLASIENIEFLKGPSTVLYGHSAVGGILNLVSKKPTQQFKANATATYGSWDTKRATIGVGGALSPTLSYRMDVGYTDRQGWRDNNDETANASFALSWSPSNNDQIDFRIGGNDDFYGTEAGQTIFTNDIYSVATDAKVYNDGEMHKGMHREQRYNDPNDFLKHENWNTSVNWKHKFNENISLNNKLSYSDDLIDYFSTEELSFLKSDNPIYDHYYLNSDGSKKYICIDSLQRSYPLRFSHETRTWQNSADLYVKASTGSIKHNALVGYSLQYIDRVSFKGYNLGTDVTGDGLYATVAIENPTLNQGDLETSFSAASLYNEWVHGIYFQDLMTITDRLNVMVGLRYDIFSFENGSATVNEGRELSEESEMKSIKNKSLSYRAGIVYDVTNDLSVYASGSSFFRPIRTVYNENYVYVDKEGKQFIPESQDGTVYDPESGYQVEGGLKYAWSNKLNVNTSAYYIRKENIKEYLGKVEDENSADFGKYIYGQVGVATSKGVDIELVYRPCSAFSWTAGYGYNEAVYAEYADNDFLPSSSNEGNTFTRAPKHQGYSWLNYKFPKGTLKNLGLSLGTTYTGEVFTSSSNAYSFDGYALVDGSISYTLKQTTLRFNVNNLFDKEYYSNFVYSTQFVPGQGRNMMLSLSIKL